MALLELLLDHNCATFVSIFCFSLTYTFVAKIKKSEKRDRIQALKPLKIDRSRRGLSNGGINTLIRPNLADLVKKEWISLTDLVANEGSIFSKT